MLKNKIQIFELVGLKSIAKKNNIDVDLRNSILFILIEIIQKSNYFCEKDCQR